VQASDTVSIVHSYLAAARRTDKMLEAYQHAAVWKVASQIRRCIFSQRDELVDAGRHALRGWKLRSENRRQLGHSCTRNSSLKSLPTSGHATRMSHSAESYLMPHSLIAFSLAPRSPRSPKR